MANEIIRCEWAAHDEWNREYHDREWGIPVHDDKTLFQMLILEGMQAGLSWITILKKREAFTKAFDDFDPSIIRNYGEEKVEELMQNTGIIRNRLKSTLPLPMQMLIFHCVKNTVPSTISYGLM